MGGPGSVKLWVTAGYGQSDYIHMTGEGYRMVGEMIVNALLELQHNEQARENR
jgi:lysophospholipase L1-like esterase